MAYKWRVGSSKPIEVVERNKRERQDERDEIIEGRAVRGKKMEGVRERQAEVEIRIAEYRISSREECGRRIENYAREQREALRAEEERRPGRLIIRYAREQRGDKGR